MGDKFIHEVQTLPARLERGGVTRQQVELTIRRLTDDMIASTNPKKVVAYRRQIKRLEKLAAQCRDEEETTDGCILEQSRITRQ